MIDGQGDGRGSPVNRSWRSHATCKAINNTVNPIGSNPKAGVGCVADAEGERIAPLGVIKNLIVDVGDRINAGCIGSGVAIRADEGTRVESGIAHAARLSRARCKGVGRIQGETAQACFVEGAANAGQRRVEGDFLAVGVNRVALVGGVAEPARIIGGVLARVLQRAAGEADRAGSANGATGPQRQRAALQRCAAAVGVGAAEGKGPRALFGQRETTAAGLGDGAAQRGGGIGAAGGEIA